MSHCSDCGSALVKEVTEEQAIRRFTLNNLQKRLLFTIGLIILIRVLIFIPVPGINFQALWGITHEPGRGLNFLTLYRYSALALGIMPYLSAYMIVEILSLFIPPLKSWRKEGYTGRTRLKKIALFATLLLVPLAGFGTAVGFENMRGASGELIVSAPGWSFRILTIITLTTGTFIMVWVADLITRKGLGHGVSVLLLAGFGENIFSEFLRITPLFYERNALGYFLMFVAIVIALTTLIFLMEKGHRRISVKYDDGVKAYVPLKLTSAGTTPAEWTSVLIMTPLTIYGLVDHPTSQKLMFALLPGKIWYFIIYSIGTIFLYYLFTSFFYNPKRMVTFLKSRSALIVSPKGENKESYIDKKLERMVPIAALYLCLVVYTPHITLRLFNFHLGGFALITAVAILLDLMEEVRLRRKGMNFVKVAELHDVAMAGLLKSILGQKEIPCFLRGYYHRALLYFFGPYIEISVLVPEDKVVEARDVIKTYMDSNILTVNLRT